MNTYIIDAIRTPIGNFGGTLKDVRTDDLAAIPIKELIKRTKINPEKINDVILGCANQAGEDNRNIARMALLLAGLPFSVPGETVNRLCASGMSAIINAHRAIKSGDGDLFIAGGIENMTRGPWVISKASKAFGRDSQMFDSSFGWRFINPKMKELYGTDGMGTTAENVAREYGISREQQEAFAFESHMKAAAYEASSKHIIRVSDSDGEEISVDGCIRASTSIESMARLPPAFDENGTVTAATSSPLTDGAVAMIVCSEEYAQRMNMPSMAKIVAGAVTGVHPSMMGIGPISAGRKLSDRIGWKLSDVDLFEVNEAFSSQSIATISELGLDSERVNIHGGAIAIGHPLGASGARILGQAASLLESTAGSRAMALMCIGGGMGIGVAIERL